MLRSSPRRTLEAIVTQAISLIVALASDLKALRDEARRNQKPSNCRAVTTSRVRGGSVLTRARGSADQKLRRRSRAK
jgi:hypothetical protein